MVSVILLSAIVVIACVLLNRVSQKIGIPMLLTFIVLGMVFGTDGILKIPFENYDFAEQICSVALIFIMFYGGFGTNWKHAKPTAVHSALLSTLGVVLTAGLVGVFCHFVLRLDLLESLLIGSVIGSTDAASVFSILRSKRLGLKDNTDSMLELESGSNDPCSYMLTVTMLAVMEGTATGGQIVLMLLSQFVFGILVGVVVALGAAALLRRFRFATSGFDMAFVIGVALLAYALASLLGGNGYLSTYLCGIILGNVDFQSKKGMVHFFDGVTGLMQMLIFFLLGLLATPSRILPIFLPALAIMLFLTFVARPAAVFALLSPFGCSLPQKLLVSFAGLRGAASIVFAIMATTGGPAMEHDLFHVVFCIVLLSIAFQGSLLPLCAKKLDMTDQSIDVMKTFNDYSEESDLGFIEVRVAAGHAWANCAIRDITLPPDTLIITLLRGGGAITPNGDTVLLVDDRVILSAHRYAADQDILLREERILRGSRWIGKTIREYSPGKGELVIMIIRGSGSIVPNGETVIRSGDVLVMNRSGDRKD